MMTTNNLIGNSNMESMEQEETPEEQYGEECRQMETRINPLNNHLVLEVIFRHLSSSSRKVESLGNSRRVCKLWNIVAQNSWQTNVETLALIDDAVELCESMEMESMNDEQHKILFAGDQPPLSHKGPFMSLDKFLKRSSDRYDKLSKFPYSKYLLVSWEINSEDFPEKNSVAVTNKQKFWKLHGAKVKMLKLVGCKFPNIFLVFRKQFLECLPNLKELQLESSELGSTAFYENLGYAFQHAQGVRFNIPEILNEVLVHDKLEVLKIKNKVGCHGAMADWQSVFLTCPNLKKLTLENMEMRSEAMISNGMFWAQLRDAAELVPNLKYVDIMNFNYLAADNLSLTASFLAQLNGRTLEHVGMDIGYRTKFGEIRKSFEFQAATLKTLCLFRAPFCKPFPSFPCRQIMICMEELHLWGNVCGSLDFLRIMPNLKVLKWNMSCYERKHDKLSKLPKKLVSLTIVDVVEKTVDLVGCLSPNIHTLQLDCQALGDKSWKKLGRLMPNVKSLQCVVKSDDVLIIICKQWRHCLEKLELMHGSNVTDNGILEVTKINLEQFTEFTWKGCPCIYNDAGAGLGPVSFGPLGFPKLPRLERVETCTRMEVGNDEQDNMAEYGIYLEPHRGLDKTAYVKMIKDHRYVKESLPCPQCIFERTLLPHQIICS